MKKLIALLLTLVLTAMMLPCIAVADEAVDTSEHVVITYMVTGDKPTNKTDEVLAKINAILTEKVNAQGQRIAELEAELQNARRMEGQARKEAAEFKIALEDTKKKILPANIAAELTAMLKKQADEAAKEALYYADRMTVEVENSVPAGAANSAKRFREYRKAQVDALRLLGALGNIGGLKDDD